MLPCARLAHSPVHGKQMISNELSTVLQALSKDAESLLSSMQSTLPAGEDMLTTPNGPSLFTLKNAALLSYLHNLVLLTAYRLRGNALGDTGRGADLVRNLVKLRLILEKVKPVESKMRSLVERLLRAADDEDKRIREGRPEEEEDAGGAEGVQVGDVDPLSFRPNLGALTAGRPSKDSPSEDRETLSSRDRGDGIYRPPRMAPVVYDGSSSAKGNKRSREERKSGPRNSTLLSELSASMSSNPYEVSSSGVGVNESGQGSSARAKALSRMDAYEEDNFTRLTMSKKDAKRRRRDEADVALGGAGLSTKQGRVGAGLEEEFGDLLRSKGSYDRVKRKGALDRARAGKGDESGGGGWDDLMGGGSSGKRNAFQKGVRGEKRKAKSKGRR